MTVSSRRLLVAGLVLGGGLLAWVLAPLRNAGFVTDDWIWLALVRHLDTPLSPYLTGILHEYFYRPSSVLLWWLAERLAGTDAAGHYLVDAGVHAGAAVLLAMLLHRYGCSRFAAVLAAVLFAVLPNAVGTVAWLSNRNELLAVAAGMTYLVLLDVGRERAGMALLSALALALALSSKETGLVFACVGGMRLAWWWRSDVRYSGWHWPAMLLPVCWLFLMRTLTLLPVGIGIDPATAPVGIVAWFALLPAALTGFLGTDWPRWLLPLPLLALLALALRPPWRWHPAAPAAAMAAIPFLMLPPLLQWPITHAILPLPEAGDFLVNLRFYYLAGVAVAICAALLLERCRGRAAHAVATTAVLLAIVASATASRLIVSDWSTASGAQSRHTIALARPVAQAHYPPGCVLALSRSSWPQAFPIFADAIVKAVAEPGADVLDCAVFTASAPAHTLLPVEACDAGAWPDLVLRQQAGYLVLRALGNLCLAGFESPPASAISHRHDLDSEPTP